MLHMSMEAAVIFFKKCIYDNNNKNNKINNHGKFKLNRYLNSRHNFKTLIIIIHSHCKIIIITNIVIFVEIVVKLTVKPFMDRNRGVKKIQM